MIQKVSFEHNWRVKPWKMDIFLDRIINLKSNHVKFNQFNMKISNVSDKNSIS